MSRNSEERIASVFLDSPNLWDRMFRRVQHGEPTYVCEYQYPSYRDYGGVDQKRHQRRYRELRHALRRLNYLIATQPINKGFILGFPVDIELIRKSTQQEHAICKDCGSRNWQFDEGSAK